jgi:hypothetical protein
MRMLPVVPPPPPLEPEDEHPASETDAASPIAAAAFAVRLL